MAYNMECLLCGNFTSMSLVAMQEHVMETHGYTRDQLRNQTHREEDHPDPDSTGHVHVFGFLHDLKDWMRATAVPGHFMRCFVSTVIDPGPPPGWEVTLECGHVSWFATRPTGIIGITGIPCASCLHDFLEAHKSGKRGEVAP